MRALSHAHPGSHFGAPSAPIASTAPIYGSRWSLKANFDISGYSPATQVILRALKKHGMFLSDGGNVALTKASDAFRTLKWADVGLVGARPFDNIVPTDFEVVQAFGDFPRVYGRDVPANGRPDYVLNNNIPVVYHPVCPSPMPNHVPAQLPTSAPVTPPAKFPVKSPAPAPVKAPTKPPVKSPTPAPVKAPTKAPVKSPTPAPVKAPPRKHP
jgi:hypothetical protein